jgi:hypothetical protein
MLHVATVAAGAEAEVAVAAEAEAGLEVSAQLMMMTPSAIASSIAA